MLLGHNFKSLLACCLFHRPRTANSTAYDQPPVIPTSSASLRFIWEWDITLYADAQWYAHKAYVKCKRANGNTSDVKVNWTAAFDETGRRSHCKISGHQVLECVSWWLTAREWSAAEAMQWWTAWDGSDRLLKESRASLSLYSQVIPIHTQLSDAASCLIITPVSNAVWGVYLSWLS